MKKTPIPLDDALAVTLVFVAGSRTRDNARGLHAHALFGVLMMRAERAGLIADELRADLIGTDTGKARAAAARLIAAVGAPDVMAFMQRIGEKMDANEIEAVEP